MEYLCKKITDTEYELIATATIDNGWHLYSQVVPEDGPIPTRFSYQSNEKYLKKGNTQEESGETVLILSLRWTLSILTAKLPLSNAYV